MIEFQIDSKRLQLNVFDNARIKNSWRPLRRKLGILIPIFEMYLPKRIQELECDLTLCGESKIRSLNANYRNKDKVTDVLSFPIHQAVDQIDEPYASLGDIFICRQVAQRQAKEFGITVEDEIIHLLVHGFLHLLGYDHELSQRESAKMQKLEDAIISRLGEQHGRK